MKKNSEKIIVNLIKKTIGAKSHQLHEPLFQGNEVKYLKDSIKKNFISTSGPYIEKFEKKIKTFTKSKYAIALVNCTESIHISLKVLGIKKNEEVLVPALTFIGTVNAISYLGAEPHFIDSNLKDFGVDCEKLEKYLNKIVKFKKNKSINKYTGRIISAIIPVHVFGHACEIERIIKIAKKFKLKVVEDAAEALGSFYRKKHLGTFGDVGCISFNGNKIITTGGGGAIITNKKKLVKKIRHLIGTAKSKHAWEYDHDSVGYNFKMPSLNAAVGLAQIQRINFYLKHKRNVFQTYSDTFKKYKGFKIFKENKNNKSNYWLQVLVLDKENKNLKNKILKYAHKRKIYLRPAWKLISSLKPYKRKQKMNLDGAKSIYEQIINLPSSASLSIK
jgi:perosamine synthetase